MNQAAESERRNTPIFLGSLQNSLHSSAVWWPLSLLEAERARWFCWLPVALAVGIGLYFVQPVEPDLWMALAPVLAASALVSATPRGGLLRFGAVGLLAIAAGFATAKMRTEITRAPVLGHEMRFADVRGVVDLVEPRPSRGGRITVRVTSIRGLSPSATPKRVRVRVLKSVDGLKPGDGVRLRATLRPPPMPAFPGAYDFGRAAWFQGLGATGYSFSVAEVAAPGASAAAGLSRGLRLGLERLRLEIGARIRAVLPSETGEIAVSLITGERGGITDATNDAYRDSGLVHVLSISGLHMVIMAGAVFLSARLLLALVPAIALRVSTKKWAAVAGLLGATGYLLISGASIATIRAFIMISIMFVAILMDRQALAMRNVALSALLILAVMPESLLDAGFQMSFAAVVALIAGYELVRQRSEARAFGGWSRVTAYFFGGIVLSTVIASLAVAPIGVYHFHKSQQYAVIANLIAGPAVNLVIMPAALVTLILMPFGLEWLSLPVMGLGIDFMTWTAYWVAALPGAVSAIPAIRDAGFALMIGGGLWLTLWQTRWRLLGLVAIAGGVALTGGREHPDVLVGRGGELVAVRGANGLLGATASASGTFELGRWLEHDGDGRSTRDARRTSAFACDGSGCVGESKGLRVAVSRHPSATAEDCANAHVLIGGPPRPRGCDGPILVLDRTALRREGTHALYLETDGESGTTRVARIETVAGTRGVRPWTERPERPSRAPRFRPSAQRAAGSDFANQPSSPRRASAARPRGEMR